MCYLWKIILDFSSDDPKLFDGKALQKITISTFLHIMYLFNLIRILFGIYKNIFGQNRIFFDKGGARGGGYRKMF